MTFLSTLLKTEMLCTRKEFVLTLDTCNDYQIEKIQLPMFNDGEHEQAGHEASFDIATISLASFEKLTRHQIGKIRKFTDNGSID